MSAEVVSGSVPVTESAPAAVSALGAASAAAVLLLEQAVKQAHSNSEPTDIAEW
jgi:hypothetical protein